MHVETAAYGSDRIDALFGARRNAAHTVDALVVVADHVRSGRVYRKHEIFALESVLVHAVTQGQLLQFAVVIALARQTLLLVFAQYKFERELARTTAFIRIGTHFHALRHRIDARGDQSSRAGSLYHAHTA